MMSKCIIISTIKEVSNPTQLALVLQFGLERCILTKAYSAERNLLILFAFPCI
jgi:hypothetical protein